MRYGGPRGGWECKVVWKKCGEGREEFKKVTDEVEEVLTDGLRRMGKEDSMGYVVFTVGNKYAARLGDGTCSVSVPSVSQKRMKKNKVTCIRLYFYHTSNMPLQCTNYTF